MKIKDLIDFEEIQDVIEIGRIKDEKELIESYIISKDLENQIAVFLDILNSQKHKSTNIYGNYGTGKSHLLAFISLVLSKPELIKYIQNKTIKEKLSKLKREYLIVKYELDAVQTRSLARTFFYRVRKQLKENYGVEIRDINYETEDKNIKELVQEIMDEIKEKYPEKGLMVIFDEFSDFLRQKKRADMNHDIQAYRQFGECSNSMDFIMIVSMQQNIFEDPKYIDQSDEIRRAQRRYLQIRITKESIEEVIAQRIVKKTSNQRMDITNEFETIKNHFSNLAIEEDRYVGLYPVHPYLIDVFSRLPFYDKRGIIQFLNFEIKSSLNEEFPFFITYDRVYDDMENIPTIKNNPEVRPVCDVIDTLKTKIDLIENAKLQPIAIKLVKALAILHLVFDSKRNGASPQELANTLFIIPSNEIFSPVDDIERILNKIREKTDGSFINKSKDGVYYLDLKNTPDYDVIIKNKMANMNDLNYINEKFVEKFILPELEIEFDVSKLYYFDSKQKYFFDDSTYWDDRKSFRKGDLVIDIGYDLDYKDINNDYTITFLGYGISESTISSKRNDIQIQLDFHDGLVDCLKKLAAIEEFITTKSFSQIMEKRKRNLIDNELRSAFTKALQNSKIKYKGKIYNTITDLEITSDVNSEIFKQIKQNLMKEDFTKTYPNYPKLKAKISNENIEGTIESIIKDILKKQGIVQNLGPQSSNILYPLGLYKENRLDVSESDYAKIILEKLDDKKNLAIDEIFNTLSSKPYGLHKELIQLILVVLLRNGDIVIISKRGKNFTASDFHELFGSGLKIFNDLKYIKKEDDIDVSKVQLLFDALELDRGLLQIQKDRQKAYMDYVEKINSINENINTIQEDFEKIKQLSNIGLPLEDINTIIDTILQVNFSQLKIKSITDLKKFDYNSQRINQVKEGYENLLKIKNLFKDISAHIFHGIKYMFNVMEIIKNDIFPEAGKKTLNDLFLDSNEIVTNIVKLMKNDERSPIIGKIDSFKGKWKTMYYKTHEKYVGRKVHWDVLDEISSSKLAKKMNELKKIKCINDLKYTEIQLTIEGLSDLKCLEFNVEELDNRETCATCNFPKASTDITIDIDNKINKIVKEIGSLNKFWEKQILNEIKLNEDKISNLEIEERKLIVDILSKGYLDDYIDNQIINAINNLLQELEIKELSLQDLFELLTKESDILKVEIFNDKIKKFLKKIVDSVNDKNIRLKIKK